MASVPLLWIVPLALYLGTFVHAFARREMIPHPILTSLVPRALIFLAVVYPLNRTFIVLAGMIHLLVFTLAALYCHGALARLRPPATDLTRFYLLVSTGGLIGGLLVALAAPLVFVDVYEYPIALALVAALLPAAPFGLGRVRLLVATVALGLVVAGLSVVHIGFGGFNERLPLLVGGAFVFVLVCAPALIFLRARPALLACALLAVFVVPTAISRGFDVHVARARTFFGVYRIVEADGVRSFYHGTTLHGREWPRADGSTESRTTYYGIGTPYFELLSALTRRPSPVVIGLAGLGTGSLACYARPGDEVRIYEIDPVVVRLARPTSRHFATAHRMRPSPSATRGFSSIASREPSISSPSILSLPMRSRSTCSHWRRSGSTCASLPGMVSLRSTSPIGLSTWSPCSRRWPNASDSLRASSAIWLRRICRRRSRQHHPLWWS